MTSACRVIEKVFSVSCPAAIHNNCQTFNMAEYRVAGAAVSVWPITKYGFFDIFLVGKTIRPEGDGESLNLLQQKALWDLHPVTDGLSR